MVSWFGPQNQASCVLSVAPQNQREDKDSAEHASRSSGLLHVEASRAWVSLSGSKTGGGVAWMVHMATSRRLRRDQVEDGRVDVMGHIGPCYPCFAVFIVLGSQGNLVF
jgi:hypothetical protein